MSQPSATNNSGSEDGTAITTTTTDSQPGLTEHAPLLSAKASPTINGHAIEDTPLRCEKTEQSIPAATVVAIPVLTSQQQQQQVQSLTPDSMPAYYGTFATADSEDTVNSDNTPPPLPPLSLPLQRPGSPVSDGKAQEGRSGDGEVEVPSSGRYATITAAPRAIDAASGDPLHEEDPAVTPPKDIGSEKRDPTIQKVYPLSFPRAGIHSRLDRFLHTLVKIAVVHRPLGLSTPDAKVADGTVPLLLPILLASISMSVNKSDALALYDKDADVRAFVRLVPPSLWSVMSMHLAEQAREEVRNNHPTMVTHVPSPMTSSPTAVPLQNGPVQGPLFVAALDVTGFIACLVQHFDHLEGAPAAEAVRCLADILENHGAYAIPCQLELLESRTLDLIRARFQDQEVVEACRRMLWRVHLEDAHKATTGVCAPQIHQALFALVDTLIVHITQDEDSHQTSGQDPNTEWWILRVFAELVRLYSSTLLPYLSNHRSLHRLCQRVLKDLSLPNRLTVSSALAFFSALLLLMPWPSASNPVEPCGPPNRPRTGGNNASALILGLRDKFFDRQHIDRTLALVAELCLTCRVAPIDDRGDRMSVHLSTSENAPSPLLPPTRGAATRESQRVLEAVEFVLEAIECSPHHDVQMSLAVSPTLGPAILHLVDQAKRERGFVTVLLRTLNHLLGLALRTGSCVANDGGGAIGVLFRPRGHHADDNSGDVASARSSSPAQSAPLVELLDLIIGGIEDAPYTVPGPESQLSSPDWPRISSDENESGWWVAGGAAGREVSFTFVNRAFAYVAAAAIEARTSAGLSHSSGNDHQSPGLASLEGPLFEELAEDLAHILSRQLEAAISAHELTAAELLRFFSWPAEAGDYRRDASLAWCDIFLQIMSSVRVYYCSALPFLEWASDLFDRCRKLLDYLPTERYPHTGAEGNTGILGSEAGRSLEHHLERVANSVLCVEEETMAVLSQHYLQGPHLSLHRVDEQQPNPELSTSGVLVPEIALLLQAQLLLKACHTELALIIMRHLAGSLQQRWADRHAALGVCLQSLYLARPIIPMLAPLPLSRTAWQTLRRLKIRGAWGSDAGLKSATLWSVLAAENQRCDELHRVFGQLQGDVAVKAQELDAARNDLKLQQAAFDGKVAGLEQLQVRMEATQTELKRVTRQRDELRDETERAKKEKTEAETELATAWVSLTEAQEQLRAGQAAWQDERAGLEKQRKEIEAALDALKAEVASLKQEKAQLEGQLEGKHEEHVRTKDELDKFVSAFQMFHSAVGDKLRQPAGKASDENQGTPPQSP